MSLIVRWKCTLHVFCFQRVNFDDTSRKVISLIDCMLKQTSKTKECDKSVHEGSECVLLIGPLTKYILYLLIVLCYFSHYLTISSESELIMTN